MIGARMARPGEESELRALWTAVFGDEPEYLDTYFRELYAPENVRVIEADGRIVSAAHIVFFGSRRYIYAVATYPEYRGRGYGRAVVLAAADGRPAYLAPAEPSLFRWYRESVGAEVCDCFAPTEPEETLTPLTPEEYMTRREELLRGVPHAEYTPGILRCFGEYGSFFAGREHIYAMEDGRVMECVPPPPGGEPYVMALFGGEALHWGLTLI